MKKNVFFMVCFLSVSTFLMASNIEIDKNTLKLIINDYSGSFSLYGKNLETGKFVPLLDTGNNSSTTVFFLKLNDIVRKLSPGFGLSIETAIIPDGASLTYTIKDEASISILFTFFSSGNASDPDAICMKMSIRNLSKASKTFALKGVFDTVLGEARRIPFRSAMRSSIVSELALTNVMNDKWVRSSSGYDSIQFLLYGGDVSNPSNIVLSNRDYLLSDIWIPDIKNGRSFDTIQTYNNSALAIYWQPVLLTPMTKASFKLYISTASGGSNPVDISVISNKKNTISTSTLDTEPIYKDSHGTVFTVGALSEEQLDPEYIADLLERIHKLEINYDEINRDEIQKLNAELDAIMIKVESKDRNGI